VMDFPSRADRSMIRSQIGKALRVWSDASVTSMAFGVLRVSKSVYVSNLDLFRDVERVIDLFSADGCVGRKDGGLTGSSSGDISGDDCNFQAEEGRVR
ncbi:hypothetical protein IscW_ISCW022901, partial [Ixodes scapularis]